MEYLIWIDPTGRFPSKKTHYEWLAKEIKAAIDEKSVDCDHLVKILPGDGNILKRLKAESDSSRPQEIIFVSSVMAKRASQVRARYGDISVGIITGNICRKQEYFVFNKGVILGCFGIAKQLV